MGGDPGDFSAAYPDFNPTIPDLTTPDFGLSAGLSMTSSEAAAILPSESEYVGSMGSQTAANALVGDIVNQDAQGYTTPTQQATSISGSLTQALGLASVAATAASKAIAASNSGYTTTLSRVLGSLGSSAGTVARTGSLTSLSPPSQYAPQTILIVLGVLALFGVLLFKFAKSPAGG